VLVSICDALRVEVLSNVLCLFHTLNITKPSTSVKGFFESYSDIISDGVIV
jgi:hypothetical protein